MRRTRWLSLVALLTALATVLNGFSVPAPYAGFLFYGVWEIPVLMALLVLGVRGGVLVGALNALALEFVNPGALPTGPLYNLMAEVSMFGGVYAAERLASGRGTDIRVVAATAVGAALRTSVMTVVNWLVLPQPYPVGFSVPQTALLGLLIPIAVFNASVVLYVVPAGYGIWNAVAARSGFLKPISREGFTT